MRILYRLLLTFNATSLIIVIFLIKENIIIQHISKNFLYPNYISFSIYSFIPIFLTYISLLLGNSLATANIKMGTIKEIELANNAFLPSYLGYFFVALSVPNCPTLYFVFLILFIFTFLSQSLYFNPLFLFFGYHFYNITTSKNVKLFIITKQNINDPNEVEFEKLKRINNFTFIDKQKL